MSKNMEILVSVIIEEAIREAEAIIEKAQKEAVCIRDKSLKKQAELQRQNESRYDSSDMFLVKAKMVSQAELQARMEIIRQKESIIENVLQKMRHEFFSLPRNPDYPLILKKLIIQGIEYLEGDEFICLVNERDRTIVSSSMMEELSHQTGKKVSVDEGCMESNGGVIIQRSDGRVLYDNTLEAIFQRQQEEMRSVAAELLFAQEEGSIPNKRGSNRC